MNGTNITANEVVNIIRACKSSRISYVKYDNLELKFDTDFHPNQPKSSAPYMDVNSMNKQDHSPDGPELFNLSDVDVKDDELMFAEMADQLNIEDPAQFEQLQLMAMTRGTN